MYRLPLHNLSDQELIDKLNKGTVTLGLDINAEFSSANYNKFIDPKSEYRFKVHSRIDKNMLAKAKEHVYLNILNGTTYDRYNYVHRYATDNVYLPVYALSILIEEDPIPTVSNDFFFI